MDIIISQRLKELRRLKGNTQDDLARHAGISEQAVSKWERGEAYPDITLLPSVAAFYGVTVDSLLGVDKIEKRKWLSLLSEKVTDNIWSGDFAANIALTRDASREFPNDLRLAARYMDALFIDDSRGKKNDHSDEIIAIGERILQESVDTTTRNVAIVYVCQTYAKTGNLQKAREYAEMLHFTPRDAVLETILTGEELQDIISQNLANHAYQIYESMERKISASEYSAELKIRILESVRTIANIIYSEFLSMGKTWNYSQMTGLFRISASLSALHAERGDKEKAFEEIRLAASNIDVDRKERMSHAEEVRSSSPERADGIISDCKGFTDFSQRHMRETLANPLFDTFRSDVEFASLAQLFNDD